MAVAAGLASFPSVFLTSGEAPGFAGVAPGFKGETTGEAVGEANGLAVWTGTGVATPFGLVPVPLFAAPEQAPNIATLAAKTVDIINDLLIVVSLRSLIRSLSESNTRLTACVSAPTS